MNRRIFIPFVFSVVLCTYYGYGQETDKSIDATQKAFILSRFCTEVKYNFVHYDKLGFDWDSMCMASLTALTATESDEEFIDEMKKLCVKLHDGHTSIFAMNNRSKPEDWIKPFPMTTKCVEDRVFVTSVSSTVLKEQGVDYGCEILAIDGCNVLEYAADNIRPYTASSTPQWSQYAPLSHYELTKAKGSKTSSILFRGTDGKTFTVTSDRNIPWDIQKSSSVFEFEILGKNIGLLKIASFDNYLFSREEFDKIYEQILRTDALIIDIRDNGGGNSSHADYIMRHFDDKPIRQGKWSSPMYIAAHGSWGFPKEYHTEYPAPMQPVEKTIYKKPMALLVNATTFSSAENFCVTFRGSGRGKIIGTPTGGSTGNPIMLDLGFGIGCRICTKNEWDADGNEFIGIGIIPDTIVEENADIFLKNKDIVIEKAFNILKKEL